jgi:hypothetical protein
MQLPKDLLSEILQYTVEDKYVLHDWVDEKKLNDTDLCLNPRAVDMLAVNPDMIFGKYLSSNPNPEAIKLLTHPNFMDWEVLPFNPNPEAIKLLRANPDNFFHRFLLTNPNPEALELFVDIHGYINFDYLFSKEWHNPFDIDLDYLTTPADPKDVKICMDKIAKLKEEYKPWSQDDVVGIPEPPSNFDDVDEYPSDLVSNPGIFKNTRKEIIERLLRNL